MRPGGRAVLYLNAQPTNRELLPVCEAQQLFAAALTDLRRRFSPWARDYEPGQLHWEHDTKDETVDSSLINVLQGEAEDRNTQPLARSEPRPLEPGEVARHLGKARCTCIDPRLEAKYDWQPRRRQRPERPWRRASEGRAVPDAGARQRPRAACGRQECRDIVRIGQKLQRNAVSQPYPPRLTPE